MNVKNFFAKLRHSRLPPAAEQGEGLFRALRVTLFKQGKKSLQALQTLALLPRLGTLLGLGCSRLCQALRGVWQRGQKAQGCPKGSLMSPSADTLAAVAGQDLLPVQPSAQAAWQAKHYLLMDDPREVDAAFSRLRNYCYAQFLAVRQDEPRWGLLPRPGLFWEAGRLAPGRPYFFLQQPNERGWLFERSGLGWLVSRCEKNVAHNLFLRQGEPCDSVVLYKNRENPGRFRVASQRNPESLLSYLVYERAAFAAVCPQTTPEESLPLQTHQQEWLSQGRVFQPKST